MVFRTNVQVFVKVWSLLWYLSNTAGNWNLILPCRSHKLQHVIGFSLMFLEEQAAHGPGLTKDWSHWRSIENPENCWKALVTSPFVIPFWVIARYIMLVLFFEHSKHSQVAPRLKVRLSNSAPQSHGLPNKCAVFGEVWWLQQNLGIFPTRQGTGIWYFHAEVINFSMSSASLWCFWKNKLPAWRSIDNLENSW